MRHLRKNRFGILLALFGAAALASAGMVLAAEPDSDAAAYGRVLYGRYCRNCHGPQGWGDGPVAELLTVRTPNLTQIAARHGGAFPAEQVTATIDGRQAVPAHGTSEMPIWGDALQRPEQGGDQEQAVRLKIHQLVEYLRSIQASPTP